jgi:Nickel responsive protein SCO4226-like
VTPLAAPSGLAYGRRVTTYLVPRTGVWLSEEEVAAATDCIPAVNDTLREHVRWIRSYVVSEPDGTFSAYCVYEATSAEWLSRHADATGLPPDAIKPVFATVVAAADPVSTA